MKSTHLRRRKWIITTSAVLILCTGAPMASAHTDAPSGGDSSGPYQSSRNVVEKVFNNPIIEQVTVIIANRATKTPTFIQGPASVIENLGGFSQVVPSTVALVKSSGPTILAIVATLARGAVYG